MGLFMIPFTIAIELVGDKTKTFWGNMAQVPFAIGEVIVCLIAMAVRDWQDFQLASSVPWVVLFLLYFVVPESPRWLLSVGRYKEARAIVEKMAKAYKVLGLTDLSGDAVRVLQLNYPEHPGLAEVEQLRVN